VDAGEFNEQEFFAALARSGARVLLIGRRALIALGAPVLTSDYDLWIHIDDIEKLNEAVEALEMVPSTDAAEARQRGRYVLENSVHVDVLVARSQITKDGATRLSFDECWTARQTLRYRGLEVHLPTIGDLITTTRLAMPMTVPHDEELDPKEFDARLAAALAEVDEVANQRALIVWFLRRYPTPAERLAYARSLYSQWTRPADPL
jgi:hypothetical protein